MSLFEPLTLAGLTLKHRVFVSPMCQYSAKDGHPTSWHLVHLGSRAVGGAALVMAEATAVQAHGRISPGDTGIWLDSQAEAWAPIAQFIKEQGAVPAIQLAHAGRKASTSVPWEGDAPVPVEQGGWRPIVAPSALAFDEKAIVPEALTLQGIAEVTQAFALAAKRALDAGFEVVEIHGAHGYLLNSFLSPLSNQRDDAYGGSFDNRIRLVREVVQAVRGVWPERLPLFLRISATDWTPGGWDVEQSCALALALKGEGVSLMDISSGGVVKAKIPVGPGYQVGLAAKVRETGVPVGAVGVITSPEQADTIIRSGQADAVFLARELLRDPYWTRRAAHALGVKLEAPLQYRRAW